jgi:imidazolonepropionase-like amidohydrolase
VRRFETLAVLATAGALCVFVAERNWAANARVEFLQSQAPQAQAARQDEHGDFVLHFLQHAIGNERYELKPSPDHSKLVLDAAFEYTDRGVKVPLSATLEMRPDFTPVHFEIKGKSYRYFNVDAAVDVLGANATVREGQNSREVVLPAQFFIVDGYSPISVQMMMMRYWLRHGRPTHLMALPAGDRATDVTIELAGHDRLGPPHDLAIWLDRYTVNNVVWGRESVWLWGNQLVAVTTYTGGLAFEAVAKDLDYALPQLIRSEVADRMKDLAAISKSVTPLAQGSFAILGATLIDGTGGPSVPDSAVIVRDGKILAAGVRASVDIPAGIRKIDAQGLTLLPGLWEMHAHYAQIEWGPAYLASGVTTARDCGNEFEFITAVRDEIAQHAGLGPRLLLAGLIDGAGPDAFGVNYATTPEEGRALVNRYKNAGFSQIKIYNLIQPEVLRAITAEAHRLGMTVTGHIPNGMNAFDGVNDGMNQINHIGYAMSVMRAAGNASRFDPASPEARKAIQFFQEHHTVVDPTVSWNELLGRPTDEDIASFEPGFARLPYQLSSLIGTSGVPPSEGARSRERLQESLSAVKALYDAGIPIVPGTDKGVPGFSLHRELELYVQAGLTPMQAIQTATIVPARVMGLDKESGTVEAGKRADLILVNGNPLEDFRALRKVTRVVTDGRLYDTASLWKAAGFKQ